MTTVTQPDLFGNASPSPGSSSLAPSRASDPQSSKDAAASVATNKQMAAILESLLWCENIPPELGWSRSGQPVKVSADDLRDRYAYDDGLCGVERNAWSSRLSAMEAKGLLEAAGEVPGRYGRPVRAFRLTEAGREAAEGLRGAA